MRKKITISNDTFASNPSDVKLKPLVWFRYNPLMVSILTLLLVLSLVGLYYDLKSIVFVIIATGINFLYWTRIKEHFLADSNPGLVIDTFPTKIAIYTNLTKGFGYYPTIKIIECPKLQDIPLGEIIPTVAIYKDSEFEDLDHWEDFYPLPLAYATNEKVELDYALQSYSAEQLNKLDTYIQSIEKPFKAGLYPIYTEDSDW